MTKKDHLTYFDGGFMNAPTKPSDETKNDLLALIKFDSKLATAIKQLDSSEGSELNRVLADTLLELSTIDSKTTDLAISKALLSAVKNSLLTVIKKLNLNQDEQKMFNQVFFENDLGRAGLSILVEICTFIFSTAVGIEPLHFAQGQQLPHTLEEVEDFKENETYLRFYKLVNQIYQPTTNVGSAEGFTRCSFGKMSQALIAQFQNAAAGIDATSLPDYSKGSFLDRVQLVGELNAGINSEDGLIYSLAKEMAAQKNP